MLKNTCNMKSASQYCKTHSLKSLAEVSRMTKVNADRLHRWFHDRPELFHVVVMGCVKVKEVGDDYKN